MAGVAITNATRRTLPARSTFSAIAKAALPDWDISLVFVGPKKAQELNAQLRKKNYVPNVLSYVVGEKSGEIIICPSEAAKQSSDFQLPDSSFLLLLFIHGALHLKGWAHSARMEKCEQELLAQFATSSAHFLPHETTHRNRNRHRHVPSQSGRRRGSRG